jgi:hypothetical protein
MNHVIMRLEDWNEFGYLFSCDLTFHPSGAASIEVKYSSASHVMKYATNLRPDEAEEVQQWLEANDIPRS